GSQYTLPVQLASFTGSFITNNTIKLEWTTISKINNYGFYVQRYIPSTQTFVTIDNSFQPGAGYTLQPQYYSWSDNEAPIAIGGNEIQYRLKQIDNDGLEHYHGPITVLKNPSNVREHETNISEYRVLKNYPNPFNPTTDIQFNIEQKEKVTLKIYNSIGQEIAILADENLEAGAHSIQFNGNNLPTGVYIAMLQIVK
ncbi:MAG: T9SS type A sorting domain-containing protein, partial [Bacteroidota bacterium]